MASSLASVSPEGALAARQLSAARRRQEPLGSRAAAFSSVLPRAQHRCASATARFVWRYRAWRQTKSSKTQSSQGAPGRAEPAISSSSAVPPLQMLPNNYSRFVVDAEMMRLACKKPSLPQKPGQSWRVLRFFGPNTEGSYVLAVPLDSCYTPTGLRKGRTKNPRLAASLSQKHRCLATFIDLQPLISHNTSPQ